MYKLPSTNVLISAALQLLADKRDHSLEEIRYTLITASGFTEEQVVKLLPKKVRLAWNRRAGGAVRQLTARALAKEMINGAYRITIAGSNAAKEKPGLINRKYPKQLWHPQTLFRITRLDREDMGTMAPRAPLEGPGGGNAGVSFPGQELPSHEEMPISVVEPEPEKDPYLLCEPRVITTWYGTNRLPVDESNIGLGFENEEGGTVRFGKCLVNVPAGLLTGQTKPGFLKAWIKGTKGIMVKNIVGMSEQGFWKGVEEELSVKAKDNSMLLFIHGFWVSFIEAAVRTAQLTYDLKMRHAAFYSWPSRNSLFGYKADGKTIVKAAPDIADFLRRMQGLASKKEVNLHVIAHSMGNRGLLLAMEQLMTDLPKNFKLSSIVFAAADVDRGKFIGTLLTARQLAEQISIYASDKDVALWLSRFINGKDRAGTIVPVTLIPGADTIDVSKIDLSKLGHGYVAEARPVITDMHEQMHWAKPPLERSGLMRTPKLLYWQLR